VRYYSRNLGILPRLVIANGGIQEEAKSVRRLV